MGDPIGINLWQAVGTPTGGYLKNFLHFSERVKVKIKRKGSLSQLITTKRYFYNVIFSSIAFIIVYVLLFVFCRYV